MSKPVIIEAYEPSEDERLARRIGALMDLCDKAHAHGMYDMRDDLSRRVLSLLSSLLARPV